MFLQSFTDSQTSFKDFAFLGCVSDLVDNAVGIVGPYEKITLKKYEI